MGNEDTRNAAVGRSMKARAIHHVAPRKVAVGHASLHALAANEVLIRTLYSAISPGTESLVFEGRLPNDLPLDERIAGLRAGASYPFAYGYALVGEIIDAGAEVDRAWLQRRVFAFHPHQDYAVVPMRDVVAIPAEVDPLAALFLPSVESAASFVLDAQPRLDERVLVQGQGVVGLLTVALLGEFPLDLLASADPIAHRRERSLALGAHCSVDPVDPAQCAALRERLFVGRGDDGLDLVIELSGNAQALNQAIELAGYDARIVVASWYGAGPAAIELGAGFHRRRIALVSSQVSRIAPRLSGRWDRRRRFDTAWRALARIGPQRFVTHHFRFDDCQRAFELVSARADGVLQAVFEYR